MAKDVVFDSERYEKQQSVKRIVIPLAALLAVLIAAAVLALLLRSGRGKPTTGGEDSNFPYVWTQDKNGGITLELSRSAAPGYVWSVPENSEQLSVTAQQDADGKTTRFTLSPVKEGRQVLVFSLEREGDPLDCIFEISALAEITSAGKRLEVSFLSIAGRQLPGVRRGGEDTLFPYTLCLDEDGDLMIVIEDLSSLENGEEDAEAATPWMKPGVDENAEEEDSEEIVGEEPENREKESGWQCVSDNETAAIPLGIIETESGIVSYLRPGTQPGTAQVRIFNEALDAELSFTLELNGGVLLPAS